MKMNSRTTALAVLLMLLLTPLVAARDAAGGAEGAADDADGQVLSVALDDIGIERDDANGAIALRIGASTVRIDYGDGEIGLLSTQTRHLGVADVYQRSGFHSRVGIPVDVIVWQRLTHIGEYVDSNENGLFDVNGPRIGGTFDEVDAMVESHEPIVKWIEFDDIEWTLTDWQEQRVEDEFLLRFTLESNDLPYQRADGVIANATLERIAYEFRVTAIRETVSIQSVPHYRVLVDGIDSDSVRVSDSQEDEALDINATVINATWKYDQVVEGWDVATDSNGSERNDTRLTVISEFAFGVHMQRQVGQWMHAQFGGLPAPRAIAGDAPPVENMVRDSLPDAHHDAHGRPLHCGLAYVSGGDAPGSPPGTQARQSDQQDSDHPDSRSRAERVHDRIREYRDTACIQRGDDIASDRVQAPQAIRSGGLHFEDNGLRIGQIRWVSNATVDGVETEVLFQLHDARPVLPSDVDGSDDSLWAGMRMVGAYNYVIGENQTHDPDFTTDVVVFESQSYGEPIEWQGAGGIVSRLFMIGLVRIALLSLLVCAVVVGVVTVGRAGRASAPMPPVAGFPLPGPSGSLSEPEVVSEWERYRG